MVGHCADGGAEQGNHVLPVPFKALVVHLGVGLLGGENVAVSQRVPDGAVAVGTAEQLHGFGGLFRHGKPHGQLITDLAVLPQPLLRLGSDPVLQGILCRAAAQTAVDTAGIVQQLQGLRVPAAGDGVGDFGSVVPRQQGDGDADQSHQYDQRRQHKGDAIGLGLGLFFKPAVFHRLPP